MIDSPAGSSAPLLMRDPDDNWNRVFCRLLLVTSNWFWATKEGILFKTLSAIQDLLSVWVSVLGRRTGGHTQRLFRGRWFFFPTDGTVSQSIAPYRHSLLKLKGRRAFLASWAAGSPRGEGERG